MRKSTYWTVLNVTHDVDVAQFVKPEVIRRIGGIHEIAVNQGLVDFNSSHVEFVEDPFLDDALVSCRLGNSLWDERFVELEHGELGGIEYLVAELAVAFYTENLQIDITAYTNMSNLLVGTNKAINLPPPE